MRTRGWELSKVAIATIRLWYDVTRYTCVPWRRYVPPNALIPAGALACSMTNLHTSSLTCMILRWEQRRKQRRDARAWIRVHPNAERATQPSVPATWRYLVRRVRREPRAPAHHPGTDRRIGG